MAASVPSTVLPQGVMVNKCEETMLSEKPDDVADELGREPVTAYEGLIGGTMPSR